MDSAEGRTLGQTPDYYHPAMPHVSGELTKCTDYFLSTLMIPFYTCIFMLCNIVYSNMYNLLFIYIKHDWHDGYDWERQKSIIYMYSSANTLGLH